MSYKYSPTEAINPELVSEMTIESFKSFLKDTVSDYSEAKAEKAYKECLKITGVAPKEDTEKPKKAAKK